MNPRRCLSRTQAGQRGVDRGERVVQFRLAMHRPDVPPSIGEHVHAVVQNRQAKARMAPPA